MLRLILPCASYLPSYTAAYDEYCTHPGHNPLRNPHDGNLLAQHERRRQGLDLPPDRVSATAFWLVDEEAQRFLGLIDIRHRLNESLLRYGGHIGYAVRLGEWNKGYGTLMLSLALPHAKALGVSRCLITCDDDNPASARVMEKNGFVLGDKVENLIDGQPVLTRRYWRTL